MGNGVTFYFMRHGETYFNRYGRIQGWSNAPLTPEGIQTIKRSGKGIADIQFDAVYSSDLQRTVETAQLVLAENQFKDHYKLQTFPELREVSFGYYEGSVADELYLEIKNYLKKAGKDLEEWRNYFNPERFINLVRAVDPYDHAENYVEFWHRIESGLLTLLNRHAGTNQNILVVSHGLTIKSLIHGLVADYPDDSPPLENASLSIVEYRQGQFQLIDMNKTDHFKD